MWSIGHRVWDVGCSVEEAANPPPFGDESDGTCTAYTHPPRLPAVVSPSPSRGTGPRELQVKCRHASPRDANVESTQPPPPPSNSPFTSGTIPPPHRPSPVPPPRLSSFSCVISPDVTTPANHAGSKPMGASLRRVVAARRLELLTMKSRQPASCRRRAASSAAGYAV